MNKRIINVTFLLVLLITLAFFINNAKIQNNNYFTINTHIKKIILVNKDFNLYLKNSFKYNNFDLIQKKISIINKEFSELQSNTILLSADNLDIQQSLQKLEKNIQIKIKLLNRVKSYRAIINSSFILVQRFKDLGIHDQLNSFYTTVMTLDKNPELNLQNEHLKIKNLLKIYSSKNEVLFLKHSKTIISYQQKLISINEVLHKTPLEDKLDNFYSLYNNFSQSILHKAYLAIIILFLLLFLSLIFYLIYDYKLSRARKETIRFKKTVEDSDNIIIITDEKLKIKYINAAFTKITGYTFKEVQGKNPKFLSSGNQDYKFYNKLNKTIFAGKKWNGEFINRSKNGKLSYERATISPVFDEKQNIIEFIAIKLDITKETLAQEQLIKKEQMLLQQSKMAALGEMLQNISHQWRQPLSLISTASTGLLVKKELNMNTTTEEDIKVLNTINDATQYLSQTINDFRDFFQPHKEKIQFNIKDVYVKTFNIIRSKFQSLDITIIEDIQDISLTNLDNELIQVLMNLLNNAKDALEKETNLKKYIFVTIFKRDENIIISIKDNAGGIPQEIIKKVFEPYFTTKHKSQGTGIGLYMCQEIISKHMDGTLKVANSTFNYKGSQYTGAEFIISISLV